MSEWKEYKLGEVLEIKYGKDHKALLDGIIPCLGSGGIMRFVNKSIYANESILIPRKGSLNNIMYQNKPFWTVDTMFWSKINIEKVNGKFLFYQLTLIDYTNLNVGSAVPSLTVPVINDIEILLSPLPEQRAIAAVLSSLDDKIDLLHRQNATLEKLAETLFRQWFIEEAKEEWEEGKLEDEFDFIMGQSPLGSNLNEAQQGTIFYQGRSDFGFRFPTPRVYTTTPTRIAKPLDTLVSVRAPVGDMNMAFEECCLGRGVAAFWYKSNPAFYSYTYYKLRSLMEPIKQFEDNGSVFGSIGKDDFKKLENIIPPQNMIEQFQNTTKSIDDKILLNEIQIRTLTQLRDTLLPKLMSGEVRVKY